MTLTVGFGLHCFASNTLLSWTWSRWGLTMSEHCLLQLDPSWRGWQLSVTKSKATDLRLFTWRDTALTSPVWGSSWAIKSSGERWRFTLARYIHDDDFGSEGRGYGEFTFQTFFRKLERLTVEGHVHLHGFAFLWGHCQALKYLRIGKWICLCRSCRFDPMSQFLFPQDWLYPMSWPTQMCSLWMSSPCSSRLLHYPCEKIFYSTFRWTRWLCWRSCTSGAWRCEILSKSLLREREHIVQLLYQVRSLPMATLLLDSLPSLKKVRGANLSRVNFHIF